MNGYAIKQSTAVQPLVFLMVDSTDHITGKTGLSPTVTISKNGAAFASPAGAVSEIGNGLYAVAANATDSGTLGPLVLHATATGADPVDWLYPIVAYDPLTVAVGANTTTPANSTIALIYALLQLTDADVASIVTLLGTPAGASLAADLAAIKASADLALRPITPGRTIAIDVDGKVNAELDSDAQAMVAAFNAMRSGNVFTEEALANAPSGTGGDATAANQEEIIALITGSQVIQVASPNVQGNLVLTQGDDYDGVANPKASWIVSTDYTSGWTVRLTIRDVDDAVIYTTTGSVASATSIQVSIATPTGLTMTGCPGQWQGKFDVELTHSSGKKKTIALGVCYINEDQTR